MSSKEIDCLISLSGDFGLFQGILSEVKSSGEQFIAPEILEKVNRHFLSARKKIDQQILQLVQTHQKPIFAVGTNLEQGLEDALPAAGFPHFRTPERAAKAAGKLYQHAQYLRSLGVF
jgi:hypothetical protein